MVRTVIGRSITTTRFITDTQLSYIHARCHCVYYCCCMPRMGCSKAIQTVKNLRYGPVQRLCSPFFLLPRLRTIRSRHTLSTHHWFHISTSDTLNCTTLPQQRHPVCSASVVRGSNSCLHIASTTLMIGRSICRTALIIRLTLFGEVKSR